MIGDKISEIGDFMKAIFLSFIFIVSSAYSSCSYKLENSELNYEGYPINFESYLVEKLSEKKFDRSFYDQSYDFEIQTTFERVKKKRFNYAFFKIDFVDNKGEIFKTFSKQRRCIYTLCSAAEVGKSIKKAIDILNKKLRDCEE